MSLYRKRLPENLQWTCLTDAKQKNESVGEAHTARQNLYTNRRRNWPPMERELLNFQLYFLTRPHGDQKFLKLTKIYCNVT